MPKDREALLHYIWVKEGLDSYFTWYNPECDGFEAHMSPKEKARVRSAVKALGRERERLESVLHDVGLEDPDPEDD